MRVSDDRIGDSAAEPVGDNRCGSVNFRVGGLLVPPEPYENIGIGHFLDNRSDFLELFVAIGGLHEHGKFFFIFHAFDKTGRYTSEANEPVNSQRRAS